MFTSNAPAPQYQTLVLLSGGLDSAVTLALAAKNSKSVYALSFNYGQPHEEREIACANLLATHYNASHHVIEEWELRYAPGLKAASDVFKDADVPGLLPNTWKPGRNMLFLVQAGIIATTRKIHVIALGVHQEDQPGYPDCSSLFLTIMENALQLALSAPINIWAPLLNMTKAEIVNLGFQLEVPFEKTWSCYAGGEKPCDKCDACIRRNNAFNAIGKQDPLWKGR